MLVPVFTKPTWAMGEHTCPEPRTTVVPGHVCIDPVKGHVCPVITTPPCVCPVRLEPPFMWGPPEGWDATYPDRFIFDHAWPKLKQAVEGAVGFSVCRETAGECETALIGDLLKIGCLDNEVIQCLVLHHAVFRHGSSSGWDEREDFGSVVEQIAKSLKTRDDASNNDLGGLTEILPSPKRRRTS